jgi:hypothetical protein
MPQACFAFRPYVVDKEKRDFLNCRKLCKATFYIEKPSEAI